ncbi:MAG: GAF domain-containing protein [Thermogemmatispora sp.]|uniref:GAF domain-containing protein n=1 Tax=Thermogemmatispora sp. TaxID=1968838 RepID=UPI002601E830|nr:GAF domain-containing protein [Thermogemmatispora sp.]MBX5456615.1 GAF domain-containing protein [Thermogemmatispora sp.]
MVSRTAPARAGSKRQAEQENYELEELRRENSRLREVLATKSQEYALLNEIIAAVGSTLKLDEILHRLVDAIVRAVSCHAAFLYLYDPEHERLVLASASEPYARFAGKVELALGQGIAGWVATTLEPVILKEQARSDPRFYIVPELDREEFQSVMTVPIVSRERQLIGVLSMNTAAPATFNEEQQRFVCNTAALVAGAIENARLYEHTRRKLNILTSLSVLSQTISSSLYLDEMLRSLAALTAQIMEADLCVIMLVDQARGRLTVRAVASGLTEREHPLLQPVEAERSALEALREPGGGTPAGASPGGSGPLAPPTTTTPCLLDSAPGPGLQNGDYQTQTSEGFNPLKDGQHRTLLSAPLVSGTEHLGLINCYFRKARRPSPEDQALLSTIANQAAIAIKNSQLVDLLTQKNLVKAFFDELLGGAYESEEALKQRAKLLGCDLERPHVVVLFELLPAESTTGASPRRSLSEEEHQTAYKRTCSLIRRRLQDAYPGSLLYEQERTLTCLVRLTQEGEPSTSTPPMATLSPGSNARLKSWLRELVHQIHQEQPLHVAAGIGNPCQQLADYRRSAAEAREALQMGRSLNGDGVTHFNDLGIYRYLYKIARMDDLRDSYQDQIARIAHYDRRKGTELLSTLETYLECAGNLTKTSSRLFVHRNTLIQRLERLQSLCDIDLQDRSNWLSLQVAIKVYKLRNNVP